MQIAGKAWLYRVKYKKKKTRAQRRKEKEIKAQIRELKNRRKFNHRFGTLYLANDLKKRDIPSETWFWNKFLKEKIDHFRIERNAPFYMYILDFVNWKYKYIIEIDGLYHEKEEQKEKDKIRDKFCNRHGYEVFRIKAYNEDDYKSVIEKVKKFEK